MKRALLLTTALLGFAAPAFAQSWTGFYAGGHLGYNIQPADNGETILFDTNLDGTHSENVNTTTGANAFSPGFCGGRANGPAAAGGCTNEKDGGEFGVRFGYDWQSNEWVLGLLAEITGNNINDSVSAFSITPARYTMTRELNWSAAARARVGYAAEQLLVFGTGGYVRGDVAHTFSTSNTVNTFTLRGGDSVSGYQYGGGAEWRFMPEWTVGFEYLRTTFDDDSFRVRSGPPAPATNPFILVNAAGTDFRRSDNKFNFGTLRLTMTYRFGG
jgi:opacity protein-like surface antigen